MKLQWVPSYLLLCSILYGRQYMFCLLFNGSVSHFKNMHWDYKESQNVRLFFKLPLTSIWDKQMRSLFFCMFLLPCCSFVRDVNLLLQIFIVVLWWSRPREDDTRSAVQEIARLRTDSEFLDSVYKISHRSLSKTVYEVCPKSNASDLK